MLAALSVMCALPSCGVEPDPATEIYVCVKPDQAAHFPDQLSDLLAKLGYKTARGKAADRFGHEMHVVEAFRRLVRVWAQNVPKDPGTAARPGISVYPNMYVISVQRRFSLFRGDVAQSFAQVRKAVSALSIKETNGDSDCQYVEMAETGRKLPLVGGLD